MAAIRAGSDYRNDILRQLTAFTHSFTSPNAKLYEQLFALIVCYVDRNVDVINNAIQYDYCRDFAAGVELILGLQQVMPVDVHNIPLPPLLCLVDV